MCLCVCSIPKIERSKKNIERWNRSGCLVGGAVAIAHSCDHRSMIITYSQYYFLIFNHFFFSYPSIFDGICICQLSANFCWLNREQISAQIPRKSNIVNDRWSNGTQHGIVEMFGFGTAHRTNFTVPRTAVKMISKFALHALSMKYTQMYRFYWTAAFKRTRYAHTFTQLCQHKFTTTNVRLIYIRKSRVWSKQKKVRTEGEKKNACKHISHIHTSE